MLQLIQPIVRMVMIGGVETLLELKVRRKRGRGEEETIAGYEEEEDDASIKPIVMTR